LLKAKKKTAPRGGEKPSNKTNRAIRLQYGVLPYRFTETNSLEVLLVTTRQTRRWIVPKGWPIKGLKPPRSAAREAYEEAGIRGTVGAKAIGSVMPVDPPGHDAVALCAGVSAKTWVAPSWAETAHATRAATIPPFF
jgi:8-oxo-dGTP pyrophosphatase MutT (NUDIX family)